jgi:glycerol-3-phosphate acyltransferase PlsY
MLYPINWSFALSHYVLAFAFGYLLGAIPFGLILTRLGGQGDIRAIGSGNIGATNVLRTGNKALAALTLLLDILKGTAAVLIAYRFFGREIALVAGFGAFIGHLFPVWLRFKGGKGVATYIGVLLGFAVIPRCRHWSRARQRRRYYGRSISVRKLCFSFC